jgi:hypothetical protein
MRTSLFSVLVGAIMLLISGCAPQLLLSGAVIGANALASGSIAKSAAERKADRCYALKKDLDAKYPKDPDAVKRDMAKGDCA